MHGQLIGVWVLVALAGCYLVHHTLRAWRGKGSGCGKGCSCDGKKEAKGVTLIPSESLTLLKR